VFQFQRGNGAVSRASQQTDATRLLKKREGEIADGKLPGIYFDRVKFDELTEEFLRDYKINGKKSLQRAEISVNHLEGFFGGLKVTQITSSKINKYIDSRLEEMAANGTINRELAALKRMMNMGARQTPPKVDRVPYIQMLEENNVRKGFFEHSDFLALRNALHEHLKGFATFAYKTGWRKSEIQNLSWDRVDMNNGFVRLESGETKNNEARTVYIDDELKEILRKQQEEQKHEGKISRYVSTCEDRTGPIKDLRGSWNKACKDAELGKRLFHDLRRTAVRNMVRAGIPERVAMMISGHKTRTIFERYNLVNDEDLKAATKKQAEYLELQGGTITGTAHKKKVIFGKFVNGESIK
jgi:integrase